MDLNIRRIASTVRPTETAASAETSGLDEHELDRLAAILLERQQRLLSGDAARSLAPDDPAGELGVWGR